MKKLILNFINYSLIIPCLIFLISSVFLTLDFFLDDFFGLDNALEILGDNYIINGEEIKLINNLFTSIQAMTNYLLYTSIGMGLIGLFYGNKIKNNYFDDSSAYISSGDNESFIRGFAFGALALPSLCILALCVFCYSVPNPILPVVPEGIALDANTINSIRKYSGLIYTTPLIFLFTGASFGTMFMLANKTNK